MIHEGGDTAYDVRNTGGGLDTTAAYDSRSGSGLAGFTIREELSHSFNVWRMDMDYRAPGSTSPLHTA